MHPTQRKLMKRIILFLSLLFCTDESPNDFGKNH